MGRAPQPLPQYTPPGPVEQMPNMATPQPQCSPLAKVHSAAVFPYQANEVATSRTEIGHLGVDVSLVPPAGICQYLIIWDFGVDWRHLKNTIRCWQRSSSDSRLTSRCSSRSSDTATA